MSNVFINGSSSSGSIFLSCPAFRNHSSNVLASFTRNSVSKFPCGHCFVEQVLLGSSERNTAYPHLTTSQYVNTCNKIMILFHYFLRGKKGLVPPQDSTATQTFCNEETLLSVMMESYCQTVKRRSKYWLIFS